LKKRTDEEKIFNLAFESNDQVIDRIIFGLGLECDDDGSRWGEFQDQPTRSDPAIARDAPPFFFPPQNWALSTLKDLRGRGVSRLPNDSL